MSVQETTNPGTPIDPTSIFDDLPILPVTDIPAVETPELTAGAEQVVRAPKPQRPPRDPLAERAAKVARIFTQADRRAEDAARLHEEIVALISASTGTTQCSFCEAQYLDPATVRHQRKDGKHSVACTECVEANKFGSARSYNLAETLRRRGEASTEATAHASRLRELAKLTGHGAKGARQAADEQLATFELRVSAILGELVPKVRDGQKVFKHGRPVRERIGGGELAKAEASLETARQAAKDAQAAIGAALALGDAEKHALATTSLGEAQEAYDKAQHAVRVLQGELRALEDQTQPWHEQRAVISPPPRHNGNDRRNDDRRRDAKGSNGHRNGGRNGPRQSGGTESRGNLLILKAGARLPGSR